MPVIEGYLAGCRAIGTTAGNLPYVVQPPDPVVTPGSVDELVDAIVAVDAELRSGRSPRRDSTRELCRRHSVDFVRRATERALHDRLAHPRADA